MKIKLYLLLLAISFCGPTLFYSATYARTVISYSQPCGNGDDAWIADHYDDNTGKMTYSVCHLCDGTEIKVTYNQITGQKDTTSIGIANFASSFVFSSDPLTDTWSVTGYSGSSVTYTNTGDASGDITLNNYSNRMEHSHNLWQREDFPDLLNQHILQSVQAGSNVNIQALSQPTRSSLKQSAGVAPESSGAIKDNILISSLSIDGGMLSINVRLTNPVATSIEVCDLLGHVISSNVVDNLPVGLSSIRVPVPLDLAAGAYFVRVMADGVATTRKIIISK